MTDDRCKAITGNGLQCSRKADETSRYCWQHRGDGPPGGKLARKLGKALPFAVVAAELIKTIVETVGPLLTGEQLRQVQRLSHYDDPKGMLQGLFDLLGQISKSAYDELSDDPGFVRVLNDFPQEVLIEVARANEAKRLRRSLEGNFLTAVTRSRKRRLRA